MKQLIQAYKGKRKDFIYYKHVCRILYGWKWVFFTKKKKEKLILSLLYDEVRHENGIK